MIVSASNVTDVIASVDRAGTTAEKAYFRGPADQTL